MHRKLYFVLFVFSESYIFVNFFIEFKYFFLRREKQKRDGTIDSIDQDF